MAPGINRLLHHFVAASRGEVRVDECKCLARGDRDVGTYYSQMPSAEGELNGVQPFANALGIAGLTDDEERAVGTQTGGIVDELLLGEPKVPYVVQHAQHIGAVAGASSHACLCGNVLPEVCMDAWQGGEVGLQQLVSTNHEVALLVALNGDVADLQVAIDGGRITLVHHVEFKGISKRYGVEDGLQVMVSVTAALYDVESKVYLGIRESNHDIIEE